MDQTKTEMALEELQSTYYDKINTMAFELLLLKLEIEELRKEITGLMVDKIELSCELAMVNP